MMQKLTQHPFYMDSNIFRPQFEAENHYSVFFVWDIYQWYGVNNI